MQRIAMLRETQNKAHQYKQQKLMAELKELIKKKAKKNEKKLDDDNRRHLKNEEETRRYDNNNNKNEIWIIKWQCWLYDFGLILVGVLPFIYLIYRRIFYIRTPKDIVWNNITTLQGMLFLVIYIFLSLLFIFVGRNGLVRIMLILNRFLERKLVCMT